MVAFFGIHDYYMDERPQVLAEKYPEEVVFQVVELSDHIEEFLIKAMTLVSAAQKLRKGELQETCINFFMDTEMISWGGNRIIKLFFGSRKPHMKYRLRRTTLDLQEEDEGISNKYLEISRKNDYDPILVSIDEYLAEELQGKVAKKLSNALKISIRRANEYYQSLRGMMIASVLYLNSVNKLHWEIEKCEMDKASVTLEKCVSIATEIVTLSNHLHKINAY